MFDFNDCADFGDQLKRSDDIKSPENAPSHRCGAICWKTPAATAALRPKQSMLSQPSQRVPHIALGAQGRLRTTP